MQPNPYKVIQTFGLALKAVGGRRQMAVVAIFLQALLQGLHLLRKPVGLLLQSLDQEGRP
jgi:hypothetical protein